jgi:hypothetical protein
MHNLLNCGLEVILFKIVTIIYAWAEQVPGAGKYIKRFVCIVHRIVVSGVAIAFSQKGGGGEAKGGWAFSVRGQELYVWHENARENLQF